MIRHDVLLSLGSNLLPEANMAQAQRRLRVLMPDIEFSHLLWTEPIGIRSPRFLNCLARGSSELSCGDLSRRLKEIECQMGSSSEEHRHGRVAIDIDLLQFDSERLRPADWQRPYIARLLADLDCGLD